MQGFWHVGEVKTGGRKFEDTQDGGVRLCHGLGRNGGGEREKEEDQEEGKEAAALCCSLALPTPRSEGVCICRNLTAASR